jgi:hypothetical protein
MEDGTACPSRTRSPDTARLYALGFGGAYLVVTIWGFVAGDQVLWLSPVDAADNVLHLLIAAAGIVGGLASPTERPVPSRPPSA